MLLTRTVAPADLLSAAELKAHLRIDHDYDDTYLTTLRSVAAAALDGRDGYLGRALLTQTWEWRLHCFPPGRELHFPLPPLQSVTSIQYQDTSDATQTLSASAYYTYTQDQTGYIKLKPGESWPSIYNRDDAITVTFIAGYSTIPEPIKQAALLSCGRLYATRGDVTASGQTQFSFAETGFSSAERALLAPYRVQEFNAAHERHW